uniref:Dynamin stalk domain-containing protein n=1 Tax=Quercus lobata TaxID=97700 RepID=A0A7N2MEG8_QUELO
MNPICKLHRREDIWKIVSFNHPWVGIVNRSQADINKIVDILVARCKEWEYFATSPDSGHLASKMGSECLAKLLSMHLESVIRAQISSITSLINKSIEELESEMDHHDRPIAVNAGVHFVLKELMRKSIAETQELKRFLTLQAEIAAAGGEALERFREESKKTAVQLLDMESSYLTGFL